MTKKEIQFVAELRKSLNRRPYFYASLSVLAFLNTYFQFCSLPGSLVSFVVGILLALWSLVNYLGDTESHKCLRLIEELMNKDPEFVKKAKSNHVRD